MALVAALAVALATWCAAAALGGAAVASVTIPGVVLALALLPGTVYSAGTRSARRVLPEGRDTLFFTAVTAIGLGVLYLAGWTNGAHVGQVARLLPLAVVALSLLWPQVSVLRYCLLLASGSLVGVAVNPTAAPWATVGAGAAIALGAVATNRLTPRGSLRLGPPPRSRGSRLAGEAVAVVVLVGIVAGIVTALVPPPPGRGGGGATPGGRLGNMTDAAPAFGFDDRLDVGAGRGRRTDKVLFRMAADGPDLWRATTYDHWDGRSWERAVDRAAAFPEENDALPGGPSGGAAGGRSSFVPPGIGDPPVGNPGTSGAGNDFVQRVTIEARAASVLVAAARPVRVVLPRGVAQVGDDASLRPPFTLIRGQRYIVHSERSAPGAARLDALGDTAATVPAAVAERYLQLPDVDADIRALAAQITASAPTTYAKVRAIERWLETNVRVTDTADPAPAGTDPLKQLLVVDRAGSPERISAAFAVMSRTLGVPSRLAVGFLPGKRAGLSGEFEVRGTDTHAWVEVWFPGVGWQRFDPTGEAPPPGGRDNSLRARITRLLALLWPLVVLVALVVGGWLTWNVARRRRRQAARPWASRFLDRLERAGRARGRPRQPEETPREYATGLAASVLPDPRLEEVGDLVTVAAYARKEPVKADRARAEEVLRQAEKAAPVRRFRRRTGFRPPGGPTISEP